ncbi:TlpA family protein disulfide reductase [Palleronia sp.]|uniref:TlpA family protein disulfide reductase n=1 Tax=Palleronia sp. TaxID=1940284 RepID=UPI0035C7CDD1
MRLLAAVLYLALGSAANAADLSGVELSGDMRKLVVHDTPQDVPPLTFETPEGDSVALAEYAGKPVLLNFWATWCAPCREEMPALDAIQKAGTAEVVTVATGRNSIDGIERFFDETGIEALPILLDPNQSEARQMAVLGLPVTVLIDAEGREVARLTGGAEWDSPEAAAVIEALGQ